MRVSDKRRKAFTRSKLTALTQSVWALLRRHNEILGDLVGAA